MSRQFRRMKNVEDARTTKFKMILKLNLHPLIMEGSQRIPSTVEGDLDSGVRWQDGHRGLLDLEGGL